jgi:peptide/nickel transport system permease protein
MATPTAPRPASDEQALTAEGTAPGPPAATRAARRRGTRWAALTSAILSNRKAAVGLFILVVFVVVAIIGPILAPYSANAFGVGLPSEAPSHAHWLGTTRVGQDIWSQLLVGTRGSIIIGLFAGLLTTLLAVVVGLTGGYLGGWVDDLLSLITNVFLTLPFVPVMIVIGSYAAAFNVKGIWVIIIMLTLTGWAYGARGKRAQVLALRSKDFVMASRVAGESTFRIVFIEILPNMISLVAATFLFSTVYAVLGEAGLEFIGLGDLNTVTWGTMLYYAQQNSALLTGAWWWFIPPGLCIGLFALSLTLVNYALDELTNPRLRVQKVRARGPAKPAAAATPPEIHDTETTPGVTIA